MSFSDLDLDLDLDLGRSGMVEWRGGSLALRGVFGVGSVFGLCGDVGLLGDGAVCLGWCLEGGMRKGLAWWLGGYIYCWFLVASYGCWSLRR